MSLEFSDSPRYFSELGETILGLAKREGASQAQVSFSQSIGLSLNMRQASVVSRTRETHSGYTLTVYDGKRQGTVHSTDLGERTLAEAAKAACAIARFTGEDPSAGPAQASLLCATPGDLEQYHQWDLNEDVAAALASRIEEGLMSAGTEVQSEGARVGSSHNYYHLATSEGFSHGVAQSFQNFSATALARNSQHSELEFWSDTAADATLLTSPEVVGHTAGSKALAYLSQQPLSSRRCAVLFDPRSAASLIGHLVQAVSGQALYTSSSFLLDKMGHQVLADHISLREDPFIPGSVSSIAFDGDGIAPQKRHVVESGELKGYFLSLYAARRLGREPTGHGLGPSNLLISSTLTQPEDDFSQMLKKLGTGLLVTSLAGNGVRLHNGDYSRGARGFWVANGEIQHAVTGITISSNLAQMFLGMVAIGSDELTQGSFRTGSILIDQMQISGH